MAKMPEGAPVARDQRARAAPESAAHRQWTPLARALAVAGDSWTLAIAAELAGGRMRLSELRARLAGVSAGLLDRYLQRMSAAGLITRSRYREMPPRVEIELTEAGRELLPVAAGLGRWGLRNAWSPARPDERVDAEALISQLPFLLDLRPPLPDAAIELALLARGRERRWLLEIRDGTCHALTGEPERDPAAKIAGDASAWIAAIGPQPDRTGLKLSGDRALARALLRALAPDRKRR
jgi:DNA-binding HxlR family transcriptional regulator